MKATIVGSDGTTTRPLDGSEGLLLLYGADGRLFPTFELTERPTIGQDGALLEQVRTLVRAVELPLLVFADTSVHARLRDLARLCNPLRGPVRLVVDHDDGSSRELVGTLAEAPATEAHGESGDTWQLVTLQLHAHDPFWRDATDQQVTFLAGLPDFFPWWPYEIAGSSIIGDVEIANDGDVEAWPVWRVRGPGGPFTATRADGARLMLDTVLGEGQEVTIDTRPPGLSSTPKSVIGPDGANWYDRVPATDELFSIPPGTQTFNVALDEATDDSRVFLSYRRRGFTP